MSKQLTGIELGVAHTTPKSAVGELYIDELGNYYMYALADGAVTKDLHYTLDMATFEIKDALTTAVAASGKCFHLCISPVTLADNEYAWVFVGPGKVTATSAAGILVNAKLFTSATAGKIDDDASGAVLLPGQTATAAFASAVTGTIAAACRMYVSN